MKAVHFGAGNIGRGFIGLLLSQSGYAVSFVTRSAEKTSLLRQRHHYTVMLANEAADSITVKNVTAINVQDLEGVAKAVAGADLVTTAVGPGALKNIAELIAKGIEMRLMQDARPLNVIACENAIRASSRLKNLVAPFVRPELREAMDERIGFPNSVVDRIVPAQEDKDPLKVRVEPFHEWVVERSGLRGPAPEVLGVHYVDSLEPYVERKLFTVNTGHCSAAYLGYIEGYQTIQEAMRDPRLKERTLQILQETGEFLVRKHHFDREQHSRYIRRILQRFSNRHLMDRIVRVGRCPIRKLSPDERFVRPAMQAYETGVDTPNLTSAMAAALLFDYSKDEQARTLQMAIERGGVQSAITKYTGISNQHPIYQNILSKYEQFLTVRPYSKTIF